MQFKTQKPPGLGNRQKWQYILTTLKRNTISTIINKGLTPIIKLIG